MYILLKIVYARIGVLFLLAIEASFLGILNFKILREKGYERITTNRIRF